MYWPHILGWFLVESRIEDQYCYGMGKNLYLSPLYFSEYIDKNWHMITFSPW